MDSGNDGGTLGTTACSDCCYYWYDMLAQNQQERYMLSSICKEVERYYINQQLIRQNWPIKEERKKVCMMK